MKKCVYSLVVTYVLLFTSNVCDAAHLVTVVWDTNVIFKTSALTATEIVLDIGIGNDFYTANGKATFAEGGAYYCSGSGGIGDNQMFSFDLQCGPRYVKLNINQDISGTIAVYDSYIPIGNGVLSYKSSH